MGPEPELPLAARLAGQAELIVSQLRQTSYQYGGEIDPVNGYYDCDCSQFVNFVLSQVAPDQFAALVAAAGEPAPRAFEYYDFFAGLPTAPGGSRQQVTVLADVARGDLLAWRLPLQPGHDTGHAVIVADSPTWHDAGYFAVRVYDCACRPHFDDTRGDGAGQWPSGVGSGFINFTVDADGQPAAFQFAPPLTSPFESRPIAIARLT
jgi:hypothetical protein